jgi:hypothetical protein
MPPITPIMSAIGSELLRIAAIVSTTGANTGAAALGRAGRLPHQLAAILGVGADAANGSVQLFHRAHGHVQCFRLGAGGSVQRRAAAGQLIGCAGNPCGAAADIGYQGVECGGHAAEGVGQSADFVLRRGSDAHAEVARCGGAHGVVQLADVAGERSIETGAQPARQRNRRRCCRTGRAGLFAAR